MAENFNKPSALNLNGNVAKNWRRFKQQFEIYMKASGLFKTSKKEQSCILLNLARQDAVEVFNTFQFTKEESNEDPKVLLEKFEAYCSPQKNVTYERHVFNTINQGATETIDAYVTDLRVKAKNCEFGSLTDELIKDRFVCGIRTDQVRRIVYCFVNQS